LLDYIDSPPLRQNVQRALNRVENYHQLRRAVSYANFGRLRFKTEHEQQIWGECARLITNFIIYYNAMLLSNVLPHAERIRVNLPEMADMHRQEDCESHDQLWMRNSPTSIWLGLMQKP
jgi:TnpA family transposase